jgi:uncharacterized membrane protein (DUF441 family)
MSRRISESITNIIETFFGGATFTLVREDARYGAVERGTNILVRKIAAEPGNYHFVLQRNGLPFTETEKRFADEVADAFSIFFASGQKEGDIVYFRTALLSSLMDVAIYRHLRSDRHRAFWSIQKLLQILKNVSYQRYEGTPATSGFIVYRNQLEKFQVACSMSDCLRYDFDPRIGISANFFRNPLAYRLVNGLGTFYACNINLQATGMVKFMNYGNRDAVDRLSHRDTLSLVKRAGDGAFAAGISHASELEVITCPDTMLVWRKGVWSLFDPDIYRSFLAGHLDAREMESLITTVYSLSKLRLGTIILVAGADVLDEGDLRKGAVGGKDQLSQLIVSFHREKTVSNLKHSGELISLLSSDGMTVFDKDGKLVDAGIIINTCTTPGLVTGGGRTTAATAASFFGKVIKVSEDGPIELYERGKCIYRFG